MTYKKLKMDINIGVIFGTIILKMYVLLMALVVLMLYNFGADINVSPEFISASFRALYIITGVEILLILLGIFQPILINLWTWFNLRGGAN